MTERVPEQRPSATEVARALGEFSSGLDTADLVESGPATLPLTAISDSSTAAYGLPAPRTRRRRLLAVCAVAMLGALLGFELSDRTDPGWSA